MNKLFSNRIKKYGLRLTLIMACVIACLFQVITVRAEDSIPADYRQILYNQDNGLGSTEVNCVYQTKSGYIYVGTDGGLYRFNGKEFKIINLWDTEKADVYFINSLFQDSKNRLWVSTNNYGLFCIDGGEILHFTSEYYNGVKVVNGVCEGSDGKIYVATAYGVYTVDDSNKALVRNEVLARHNIKGVTLAGGFIWGIYNGNTIFNIEPDGNVTEASASGYTSNELSTIASDEAGVVYIGTTGNDVIKMTNINSGTVIRSGRSGINMLYPAQDRIYICADTGIGYIKSNGDYIAINGGQIDSYITSMAIDYEGSFWFASNRFGLLYMGRGKFSDFNNMYDIPQSSTNCITDFNGMRFIGTDDGLVVLDLQNRYIVDNENISRLTEYLKGTMIKHIMNDSRGNLWISTYRRFGLVKVNPDGSIKTIDRFAGLNTNQVNLTYELRDGSIAVGTDDGLSIVGTDDEVVRTFAYIEGIEYPIIRSIYQDDQGRILLGTDGGGMYTISGNEVEDVDITDDYSSNVIADIEKGSKGLWIATDNGLYYYDEVFRSISNIDFSNNIYDIIYDDGRLWLIGSKGLLVASEDELLSTSGVVGRYLTNGDGLNKRLNINAVSMLDGNGILYLCCSTGILTFDTNNYYMNDSAPLLMVSDIDVDGQIYSFDKIGGELSIPSNTQRIAISFAVLSFNNRENMSVSYCLKGFDTTAVQLSGNDTMQAVYTNLETGTYTFSVSAVNGDGRHSDNEISFTIIKEPGFFEKKSVLITIGIFLFLILAAFLAVMIRFFKKYMFRQKAFEQLEEEHKTALKANAGKTDYLANMSNEIKTPVNAMIALAVKLIKNSEATEEEKTDLRNIVDTGNNVLERVDETIKLARLESGTVVPANEAYSLTTLICDLSDRMMNILTDKPVKFLVDLGDSIPDVLMGDFDKLKSILEIILDNASKYTQEGTITLSVDSYVSAEDELKDDKSIRLILSVSDTGMGMSRERLDHVFEIYYADEKNTSGTSGSGVSLVIAKKLTEILGGELEVESTYGAGTTFTLVIKQTWVDTDAHPVLAAESGAERVSREEAEKMWAPDVRALLVDDSELSRDVAMGVLSRLEMKCDVASNGVSAVDMVMNHEYDIVFMDIAMPVMNGIDAMNEIRELSDANYRLLPIIGMTEDALLKKRDELIEDGFSDVIIKPFDITVLASMMLKFVDSEKVKIRTNDVKQYMTESRFGEGLKLLENNFDVIRTLDRIGGNIEVYNKILSSFYNQNNGHVDELKTRFAKDYRGFRTRIHNIRTGCQNMGAIDSAEITMRLENAINLGNKDYVRDNLDVMIDSLNITMNCIKEYFDFLEGQRGITDEEYAASHKKDTNNLKPRNPQDVPAIDLEALGAIESAIGYGNETMIDEIFSQLNSYSYSGEDVEFIEVLGKNIEEKNYEAVSELIDTYINLKSS